MENRGPTITLSSRSGSHSRRHLQAYLATVAAVEVRAEQAGFGEADRERLTNRGPRYSTTGDSETSSGGRAFRRRNVTPAQHSMGTAAKTNRLEIGRLREINTP